MKRGDPTKKTKKETRRDWNNGHTNGQWPSTATSIIMTSYHNIVADLISSPVWVRLTSYTKQQTEFLTMTSTNMETQQCCLAPQNKRRRCQGNRDINKTREWSAKETKKKGGTWREEKPKAHKTRSRRNNRRENFKSLITWVHSELQKASHQKLTMWDAKNIFEPCNSRTYKTSHWQLESWWDILESTWGTCIMLIFAYCVWESCQKCQSSSHVNLGSFLKQNNCKGSH